MKQITLGNVAGAILVCLFLLLPWLAIMWHAPIHPLAVAVYSIGLLSPALAIVCIGAWIITRRYNFLNYPSYLTTPIIAILAAWNLVGTVFAGNVYFDKSSPEIYHYKIATKNFHDVYTRGRGYGYIYNIYFDSQMRSPLQFLSNTYEKVDINSLRDYNEIRPTISTIDVTIRQGFFGFPYIAHYNEITP